MWALIHFWCLRTLSGRNSRERNNLLFKARACRWLCPRRSLKPIYFWCQCWTHMWISQTAAAEFHSRVWVKKQKPKRVSLFASGVFSVWNSHALPVPVWIFSLRLDEPVALNAAQVQMWMGVWSINWALYLLCVGTLVMDPTRLRPWSGWIDFKLSI